MDFFWDHSPRLSSKYCNIADLITIVPKNSTKPIWKKEMSADNIQTMFKQYCVAIGWLNFVKFTPQISHSELKCNYSVIDWLLLSTLAVYFWSYTSILDPLPYPPGMVRTLPVISLKLLWDQLRPTSQRFTPNYYFVLFLIF